MAPDSFKGVLSAGEAAHEIACGLRESDANVTVRSLPLADGGEGTIDVLESAGAEVRQERVSGPHGQQVEARWALHAGVGYVEIAQAAGHGLVIDRSPASAMSASTAGVGELISAALEAGCRSVVLGVGGSATSDGGAGMLSALGARVLDSDGRPVAAGGGGLSSVSRVELSCMHPRLSEVDVLVASDVDNPLLGPQGTATVFAPQKGAGPDEVRRLEDGLRRWSEALATSTGLVGTDHLAGAGAGGGTAFAAMTGLRAARIAAAPFILDLLGVDAVLAKSDLAITGEGSLDLQTLGGKGPRWLADRAGRLGVPVGAIAGRVDLDHEQLLAMGIEKAWDLASLAVDQEASIRYTKVLLRRRASDVLRWWAVRKPGQREPLADMPLALLDTSSLAMDCISESRPSASGMWREDKRPVARDNQRGESPGFRRGSDVPRV